MKAKLGDIKINQGGGFLFEDGRADHIFTREDISEEQQTDIFDTMKRFFALDLDAKMEAHSHKNAAIRGYEPMLETQLDPRTKGDIKEAYSIGDCVIETSEAQRMR